MKDLSVYRIGVQSGSRRESFLRENAVSGLQPVISPEQNMGKLLLNRIDLWYTSYDTLLVYAQAESIDPGQFKEVLFVRHDALYIGFNHQTPDAVVARWQKTYKELYFEGAIKGLFELGGVVNLYPDLHSGPLPSLRGPD